MKTWHKTEEWFLMEVASIYQNKPFKLPADELNLFKHALISKIEHLLKCNYNKSPFNSNGVRFLWFLYLNLDPQQKTEIEVDSNMVTLTKFANMVSVHVSDLTQMTDPECRYSNWSTTQYVELVHGLSCSSIIDLPVERKRALIN